MLSINPLKPPLMESRSEPASDAPRNIFRTPRPEHSEAYGAGDALGPSTDPERDARLRRLMSRLAGRMWRGAVNSTDGALWSERLAAPNGGSAHQGWENPSIPSGYTYLLQLIAHDVVDSIPSAAVDFSRGTSLVSFLNARRRPLLLDTIYGGGPDSHPHAYDVGVPHLRSKGALPRNRLRLGEIRGPGTAERSARCPFHDIARASMGHDERAPATEALIADPRNDLHALISQLTVLFHLLHNGIIRQLETPDERAGIEQAYRQFHCARLVVTLLYRHMVAQDVLPRILDPRVHELYAGGLRLDEQRGVSIEFTVGAFRFGHAMVRETYNVNAGAMEQAFRNALELSSRRDPGRVPLDKSWAVDWRYFFGDGPDANLSRRLGPYHSDPLVNSSLFPRTYGALSATANGTERGLALRDMLSASFSGAWSVRALCDEIRYRLADHGHIDLVPSYAAWREALALWLDDSGGHMGEASPYLTRDEIRVIADDPPLPLFILFEAAHEIRDGAPVTATTPGARIPGQGGRHLGPVGSVIVAETLFGMLGSRPFGFDELASPLQRQIESCCGALLGRPHALAPILGGRRLASMADLFGVLEALQSQPTSND